MKKLESNKKNKWQSLVIFLIFLIVLIIIVNRYEEQNIQKILRKKDFTTGQIISIYKNRFGNQLVYTFHYKNKNYTSKTSTGLETEIQKRIINTYWPVIISKEDPTLQYILIVENDFKRFNLRKPDSLINTE